MERGGVRDGRVGRGERRKVTNSALRLESESCSWLPMPEGGRGAKEAREGDRQRREVADGRGRTPAPRGRAALGRWEGSRRHVRSESSGRQALRAGCHVYIYEAYRLQALTYKKTTKETYRNMYISTLMKPTIT
jgi:hypothetical protein